MDEQQWRHQAPLNSRRDTNAVAIEYRHLTPQRGEDLLGFFDGPAFADNPHWATCYCYAYQFKGPRMRRGGAANGRQESEDGPSPCSPPPPSGRDSWASVLPHLSRRGGNFLTHSSGVRRRELF